MYDFNVPSQFGPATVRIGLPPVSLLSFPPAELPVTVPAPHVVYAVTVVLVNRINKSRGYKPYAFSHSRLFKLLVVLHNVFLAVYSAWTFIGMFQAFSNSLPDRDEPNGLVGVVDALCKINGPRGYGNAATYSSLTDQWSIPNPAYQLANGVPDPTDAGRLWNQGLAYFGWIFYLSKFYEVIDTAIILAKGKKSSTLQTYHHAGAMMCMWAGIRYMAAPIWIFALVNSGIHAMMYTYYTFTALHIRVPNAIKRSLTSMQITQFIFGTNMAAAYLFVEYTVPYPVGSPALRHLSHAIPAANPASAPSADAGVVPWLKKLAFRAAGADGIAGNVGGAVPSPPTGYTQEMVPCVDTTGQAFAIWLNVSYLLPLTYLFVRFFVRSYLKRKDPGVKQSTHMEAAEKAGMDALKGVSREIQRAAIQTEASEVSTDDEVIRAYVKKVAEKQNTQDSPMRTRSSAASKAKAASGPPSESEEGFSKVPARKGAKKQTVEERDAPSAVPEAKGQNPFGVLDRGA
ncbi:hypothetical protein N7470_003745 [Penicillium chermesinum]|nr:hypothetical protein N7470_003745 [Penicillium chermesinum]